MSEPFVELFWNAQCSCGWSTNARRNVDDVGYEVTLHLQEFHRERGATVAINSWSEAPPATGEPPSAPSKGE